MSVEPSASISLARARAAEAALAVGSFAIGTGEFAAMGFLPSVADGFGVTVPQAGAVISAYALGVVVGAPVFAVLGAKLARRHFLLLLMAIFGLGNIASGLAASFPMLIGLRFVSGLPHGAYFGVASLVAAGMAGPGGRAKAVGRVMLGLTVATLLGTPLATWAGSCSAGAPRSRWSARSASWASRSPPSLCPMTSRNTAPARCASSAR